MNRRAREPTESHRVSWEASTLKLVTNARGRSKGATTAPDTGGGCVGDRTGATGAKEGRAVERVGTRRHAARPGAFNDSPRRRAEAPVRIPVRKRPTAGLGYIAAPPAGRPRSEERRVGKE